MLCAVASSDAGLRAQSIPPVEARRTPLHWAAEEGRVSIARGLIANGARVNEPDQFGRTPLHYAVRWPDMVIFLINAGANVNASDFFARTPLHLAIPHIESVVLLIDYGADVNARDFMDRTPLETSLRYGTTRRNLQVMELLIAAGAR